MTAMAAAGAAAWFVLSTANPGSAPAQVRMALPGPIGTPAPRAPGPGFQPATPLGRRGTLLPPAPGSGPATGSPSVPGVLGPRTDVSFGGGGLVAGRGQFRPIDLRPTEVVTPLETWSAVGGRFEGSGVTIDGAYVGDRWRLAFHVGSPLVLANGRLARFVPYRCVGVGHGYWYGGYRRAGYWPWWWSGSYLWPYGYAYDYWDYSSTYPVYGTGSPYVAPYVTQGQSPQAQAPAAPVRELTTIEKAQAALQSGAASEAVNLFREHLRTAPEDTASMRLLAVALLDDRRLEEAAAVMALAYEREPTLARVSLDTAVLPGGAEGLRRRVVSASIYANRVETAAAWTLLVTLMQAEGRDAVARATLQKARAKGLSPTVVAEFDSALRK
jgi:hypothetical protein